MFLNVFVSSLGEDLGVCSVAPYFQRFRIRARSSASAREIFSCRPFGLGWRVFLGVGVVWWWWWLGGGGWGGTKPLSKVLVAREGVTAWALSSLCVWLIRGDGGGTTWWHVVPNDEKKDWLSLIQTWAGGLRGAMPIYYQYDVRISSLPFLANQKISSVHGNGLPQNSLTVSIFPWQNVTTTQMYQLSSYPNIFQFAVMLCTLSKFHVYSWSWC